ncbi:MAG: glycosyltransferase family 2 protein [Bacteroidota bacterium]
MQDLTFPRISAVVITYNESENIRSCLEALQRVADEVVVVDAFSEDDTVEICVRMGVKVLQRKWQGYSASKNYGNENCENDWILSIDADEVLSEELIASIKRLPLQKGRVYRLDRINNFCGQWIRHSGWYPDWKIRLFNRTEVHWEGDYVHETLRVPSHFREEKLWGKLWHYSYKSVEDHLQRIERYSELAAQELFAGNKRPSPLRQMLSPYARFWNTFLFKLGFLDGRNGYLISKHNALLVRKKYHKLEGLYEQKSFRT